MSNKKFKNGKTKGWFQRHIKRIKPDPQPTEEHIITLTNKLSTREEGLVAICSCGKFQEGPSTQLMRLGLAAKKHSEETGHKLRSH